MAHGATLPVKPEIGGKQADGHFTPTSDKLPQRMVVPPRRVLPIIFLPGIMGSNLRMNAERQARIGKKNNIAWRPDSNTESLKFIGKNAAQRQLQLDPLTTEVDTYDPVNNPTGDADETADQRQSNIKTGGYNRNFDIDTPMLMDDLPSTKGRKTKEQKARERGWGEIFFDSYKVLLTMCEMHLNAPFDQISSKPSPTPWWARQILNVPPANWQAMPESNLKPMDHDVLRSTVTNCWFPVHAMGYNWLKSNGDSGTKTADRIRALIAKYKAQGFQCEKVIVVTHSMGGLVARALIHPAMGNLKHEVLGIIHGVMPADGAGTAYKRMHCGFEPGPVYDVTANVLGDTGTKVTAVLGNAQGGMELLPNRAYGNEWLQIRHQNTIVASLPKNGDPYEEIYKSLDWYGLLNERTLNPAMLRESGVKATRGLLDGAKAFHDAIANTFHGHSYAHYGADPRRLCWQNVIWDLSLNVKESKIGILKVIANNDKGILDLADPTGTAIYATPGGPERKSGEPISLKAMLRAAADPGDQTVPLHSAESQLTRGKFKGIFRQSGYEHQNSYNDDRALNCTLYSIIRIAHTMPWSEK